MATQGTNTNFSDSGNSYGLGPSTNTAAGSNNNYGPGPGTYAPTSSERSVPAKVAANGRTMSTSIQDLRDHPMYAPRPGANGSTSGGSTEPRVAPNGYRESTWKQDLTDDSRYASQKASEVDKSRSSTRAGSGRHSHGHRQGGGGLLGAIFLKPESKKKDTKGRR